MDHQLTFSPRALEVALASVKPAVTTRSARAALSGVRICGDYNGATLVTTDMELAARRRIGPTSSYGDVDVLVPHGELVTAVKRFSKRPQVRITQTADGVTVGDDQREIKLRSLRREDWPNLNFDDDYSKVLVADGERLASAIGRAVVFASKDETRPILTGLCFDTEDVRGPNLVGTDSYRLSVIALSAAVHKPGKLVVPARALRTAAKTMKGRFIAISRNDAYGVTITGGDVDWWVRRIDGQYPNWKQLVPETDFASTVVHIPRDELREACETAVAFCHRNAPMRLSINGTVDVSGRTPDGPSFTETLTNASVSMRAEPEFEIGFNPGFALDIAKVARDSLLTLHLHTPMRPGLFKDGDDRYLLMPIRLNV